MDGTGFMDAQTEELVFQGSMPLKLVSTPH